MRSNQGANSEYEKRGNDSLVLLREHYTCMLQLYRVLIHRHHILRSICPTHKRQRHLPGSIAGCVGQLERVPMGSPLSPRTSVPMTMSPGHCISSGGQGHEYSMCQPVGTQYKYTRDKAAMRAAESPAEPPERRAYQIGSLGVLALVCRLVTPTKGYAHATFV